MTTYPDGYVNIDRLNERVNRIEQELQQLRDDLCGLADKNADIWDNIARHENELTQNQITEENQNRHLASLDDYGDRLRSHCEQIDNDLNTVAPISPRRYCYPS